MIIYALLVIVVSLVFGVLIHLVYKYLIRRHKYKGVTFVECSVILIGSVPGLAGCAAGFTGFGFPLPLIVGLPLDLVFSAVEACGWTQSLIFDDPYLTKKFASFPIAWLVTIAALLIYYKVTFIPIAHCPVCTKTVKWGYLRCKVCKHEFTEEEIEVLKKEIQINR